MQIKTFYPQNSLLKKYIEYYYFFKSESSDFNQTFYSFPHTVQALNIYRNAGCELKQSFTRIYENRENEYLTTVQGYCQTPLLVNFTGKVDKVTIIFKPLGLNHFLTEPFKAFAGKPARIFSEWERDENYSKFLAAFYRTDDLKTRAILLEDFLAGKFRVFSEASVLQKAVRHLTDFENERSIEEIARLVNLNIRTFNRSFNKHFGISPIAFKRNARFRYSVRNKLFSQNLKTLSEICYESNFYDQSYFIKMYQKLTGDNPSKFFSSVEKLADDRLVFRFVKG